MRSAAHADRAFDGFLDLVPGHARDEEFPVVDRLGEPQELGTFTQKIRTHRQHDVNVLIRLLAWRAAAGSRTRWLPPGPWRWPG